MLTVEPFFKFCRSFFGYCSFLRELIAWFLGEAPVWRCRIVEICIFIHIVTYLPIFSEQSQTSVPSWDTILLIPSNYSTLFGTTAPNFPSHFFPIDLIFFFFVFHPLNYHTS
jgi:hypothetical protein